MPAYQYEGADYDGGTVSGVVEAENRTEAVSRARQNCRAVLSIRELAGPSGRDLLAGFRKISSKSLSLVCRQFSIILKGGLPLVQAVDLAAEQCGDKELTRLLRQVSGDVSNGWSLSYSFEQRGAELLPVTFLETVRAGESSGDLRSAFSRLAEYFDRINRTHDRLAGALTYPAFVLVTAIAVIAVIMGYAVPTFTSMFSQLGADLPWATRTLIAISEFFRKYALLLVVLTASLLIGLRVWGTTENGALRLARVQLRIPILGGIVRMTSASQFAHTMSALLSAGLPILQAIDVAGRTMQNRALSREVLEAIPGVAAGRPLGECLRFAKDLPEMLTRMTAVGETAGAIESMLRVLAEYYDNEADVRLKRFLSLLEPAVIVTLAVFVAFILLSVYLPMFGMYSKIQ